MVVCDLLYFSFSKGKDDWAWVIKGEKKRCKPSFLKEFLMINAHLNDWWLINSGLKMENLSVTSWCISGYYFLLYRHYQRQFAQNLMQRETLNPQPQQGAAGVSRKLCCLLLQRSLRRADTARSLQAWRLLLMSLGMLRAVQAHNSS